MIPKRAQVEKKTTGEISVAFPVFDCNKVWVSEESAQSELNLLKKKLEKQILEHGEELEKRNKDFDFYEGRKLEAEVIYSWFMKLSLFSKSDTKNGVKEREK